MNWQMNQSETVEVSLKLKLGDKELELTRQEASDLYYQLSTMFKDVEGDTLPSPEQVPWTPPMYPNTPGTHFPTTPQPWWQSPVTCTSP